jgi:hypothetical protein
MGGTARLTSMYEDLKAVARRTLTSMAHIDDSLEREVRTVCTICTVRTIHYLNKTDPTVTSPFHLMKQNKLWE